MRSGAVVSESKKGIGPIAFAVVGFVVLVVIGIWSLKDTERTYFNVLGLFGSVASLVGLIFVIAQINSLAIKAELINKTYKAAISNVVYSDLVSRVQTIIDAIPGLQQSFQQLKKDSIQQSCVKVIDVLDSIDIALENPWLADKIDRSSVATQLTYWKALDQRIFETTITEEAFKIEVSDYAKLMELSSLLKVAHQKLRMA